MEYTEAQKTKLLLVGLLHHPKNLDGIPAELKTDIETLIAKIDKIKIRNAMKIASTTLAAEISAKIAAKG